MFPFVIQMGEVEEFKLRQALQAMGLHDSAYWLSWHIYQSGMALLFGFFIRVFGIIFQLRIFHLTARQILFRLSAVVLRLMRISVALVLRFWRGVPHVLALWASDGESMCWRLLLLWALFGMIYAGRCRLALGFWLYRFCLGVHRL